MGPRGGSTEEVDLDISIRFVHKVKNFFEWVADSIAKYLNEQLRWEPAGPSEVGRPGWTILELALR